MSVRSDAAIDWLLDAATKAANEGYARVWATEFKDHGITTNIVAPGPVNTDMWKVTEDVVKLEMEAVAAIAEVEDVSDVVCWLSSVRSRWVTGQTIEASLGMLHA